MGIADNTIVVYVSDQGYFLGEHGFFDKRMFYEESAYAFRYPLSQKDPCWRTPERPDTQRRFRTNLAEFAGEKWRMCKEPVFVNNLEGKTPPTGERKSITDTGPIMPYARHISPSGPIDTN